MLNTPIISLRACRQLDIEAITVEWDGNSNPEAFVTSMNLHRRHLNESQRGTIAAKLATMKRGDVRSQKIDPPKSSGGVEISTPQFSAAKAAELQRQHNAKVTLRISGLVRGINGKPAHG